MPLRSDQYERYLKSLDWAWLRSLALFLSDGTCQRCGECGGFDIVLQVHHRIYERLGAEKLKDLEVLCPGCHVKADRERAATVAREQYHRRMNGWASKVYGENDYHWPDNVAEQFDEWLEEHGDDD